METSELLTNYNKTSFKIILITYSNMTCIRKYAHIYLNHKMKELWNMKQDEQGYSTRSCFKLTLIMLEAINNTTSICIYWGNEFKEVSKDFFIVKLVTKRTLLNGKRMVKQRFPLFIMYIAYENNKITLKCVEVQ